MDDIRYEPVEIATRSPVLFTDVGNAPALKMRGELYRPPSDETAPYPAVLVSDARGGLKEARIRPYARHLAENGHVVLVLDSFAARGMGAVRRSLQLYAVTEAMMLADAFAGLAHLAGRPDVDPAQIHHLGFAHGGLVAHLSAFDQIRATFGAGERHFARHASFYGSQALRLVDYRTQRAPAAIFYGGEDDTLNHARLDLLAGDLRAAGGSVTITGYDAARHEWDREEIRPRNERLNLRRLAGRIDPDGRLLDEASGKPILTRRARGLWLARAAAHLAAVQKQRQPEIAEQARADLLRFLTTPPAAPAAEQPGAGPHPAVRMLTAA